MFVGDVGFPPENYLTKPLSEQNLVAVPEKFSPEGEPIGGLELAIGISATRPAVARSRAVEVTYRVGDSATREEFPAEIYLCSPQEEPFPGRRVPGMRKGSSATRLPVETACRYSKTGGGSRRWGRRVRR